MFDILLVEDNLEMANVIKAFLKKNEYKVNHQLTGEGALDFIVKNEVKLILLDITLTGIDGFAVCRKIRETKNVPIMIISARVEKEDKLNGFQLGADDYIEKPIDVDILIAKISALMKRYYGNQSKNTLLKSKDITIDKTGMKVWKNGSLIELNLKEFELLILLIENKGKALNKDYIFGVIWGIESESENQTLTVHINKLRSKIEEDPRKPKIIKTIWGVGYRYEEV